MDAPEVAVLKVTLCAELYVPAPGLKIGALTGPVTVRVAMAVWESVPAVPVTVRG